MKKAKLQFPKRRQFDRGARAAVVEVFDFYDKLGKDFGAEGKFNDAYCKNFTKFLGVQSDGGCVAFASGTSALYATLRALNLAKGSEVLVSPITDPGMINAVIMNGLVPRVVDFATDSMFTTVAQLEQRTGKQTKAILLNHLGGRPLPETQKIYEWACVKKMYFIEDASQCHGGYLKFGKSKKMVGTMSHASCFSTMFSKNHSSGGAGGLVFSEDLNLFRKIKLEADKGKPRWQKDFVEKNPNTFLAPALNLGLNEISAALGLLTLSRLRSVNRDRNSFLKSLSKLMRKHKLQTRLLIGGTGDAPYFAVFEIDPNRLLCSKLEFAESIQAAGIPINTDYKYLVSEWPWVKNYLADDFVPKNARKFLSNTFNLLFNENFEEKHAKSIVDILCKAEAKYVRY